jgi:L-fucose mutarotase
MPLKGIPDVITPELLYALAKMGHGDSIIIADANFPSDSIANFTNIKSPIRVSGETSDVLKAILTLIPLDSYSSTPVRVMERVDSDQARNLFVPAYEKIALSAEVSPSDLNYIERFQFYEASKTCFCVVQTNDRSLYANVIISKGVL